MDIALHLAEQGGLGATKRRLVAGGDDLAFDPMQYGMPPKAIESVDPMQLMGLEVAWRTLVWVRRRDIETNCSPSISRAMARSKAPARSPA